MARHRDGRETTAFFSSIVGQGGHKALPDSDGDPHSVHLVLESQQAVGNALLVAGKTNPNPLDVTVGGEGERELGTGLRGREECRTQEGDFERSCGEGGPAMAGRSHILTWAAN